MGQEQSQEGSDNFRGSDWTRQIRNIHRLVAFSYSLKIFQLSKEKVKFVPKFHKIVKKDEENRK